MTIRSAYAWISTGRPTALAFTEYLLLSKRTRQVFDTEAGSAWKPSNRPRYGTRFGRSLLEYVPHCLIWSFRMGMRLGVGDALVQQPGRSATLPPPASG